MAIVWGCVDIDVTASSRRVKTIIAFESSWEGPMEVVEPDELIFDKNRLGIHTFHPLTML
jgi:hypothetical protein